MYRGADKSLARPDWKNNWKIAIFCPTRRLDGQTSEFFFLSGLQKLEFGRCSLFLPGRAKDLSALQYIWKQGLDSY